MRDTCVDLFGCPLENHKSDDGFQPAVRCQVRLWPHGVTTKWNHVSLQFTVFRKGERNSSQPHDFI